jgi:CRISPR-associated protein Cas1
VEDGNLVFTTAGFDDLEAGAYDIPYQQVSNILLGPGGVVSHDALRILARRDTGLLAVGSKGVRLYATSMPFGPDRAERARTHARMWGDEETRVDVARDMYRRRVGGELPAHQRDLDSLRGIEGRRMKKVYQNLADQYGIEWNGRRYDRDNPDSNDTPNKALNHAVTAVYAAARIAVAVTGTVPELGFIHESSGRAFALDIADLFRSSTTIPIAFRAAKKVRQQPGRDIEPTTRKLAGSTLRDKDVIPDMIDTINDLLSLDDDRGDA